MQDPLFLQIMVCFSLFLSAGYLLLLKLHPFDFMCLRTSKLKLGQRFKQRSMKEQNSPDSNGDSPIVQDAEPTYSPDQQIKYLFKTEGTAGQVTYRVIHVADGQVEQDANGGAAVSVVTGFPTAAHAISPPVTQSDSLEGEASETQYYYPATIADAAAGTMVTNIHTADTVQSQPSSTGQLYVMMSPQDVLATTQHSKPVMPRTSRDDKRRAQHNEVERRRRDKINNWIVQLSKTIPDCNVEATKNGQSKGGILSKACDFIQELRQSNARLEEELNSLARLKMDNQLLKQEVEEWKSKNQMIRNQLRQHGIVGASVDTQ